MGVGLATRYQTRVLRDQASVGKGRACIHGYLQQSCDISVDINNSGILFLPSLFRPEYCLPMNYEVHEYEDRFDSIFE